MASSLWTHCRIFIVYNQVLVDKTVSWINILSEGWHAWSYNSPCWHCTRTTVFSLLRIIWESKQDNSSDANTLPSQLSSSYLARPRTVLLNSLLSFRVLWLINMQHYSSNLDSRIMYCCLIKDSFKCPGSPKTPSINESFSVYFSKHYIGGKVFLIYY